MCLSTDVHPTGPYNLLHLRMPDVALVKQGSSTLHHLNEVKRPTHDLNMCDALGAFRLLAHI